MVCVLSIVLENFMYGKGYNENHVCGHVWERGLHTVLKLPLLFSNLQDRAQSHVSGGIVSHERELPCTGGKHRPR